MTALQTAKRAVKRSLASRLGWRVAAPWVRPAGVIVLTYHRIKRSGDDGPGLAVDRFATQMRWVAERCRPIGADAFVDEVRGGRRSGRPAVLVTFDDGYRDYYDVAYPVLAAHAIPAVVFLATSFIDEGGVMWTDRVRIAVEQTARTQVRVPWSAEPVALPDGTARAALSRHAREHLKKVPDEERRELMSALLRELGEPPAGERQMLTWDEVRRAMPLTCFGGHTHTHPILSRVTAQAADVEIGTCKARIAQETGVTPTTFAYPNGRRADYTAETQTILRRHGFQLAFTTSEGVADGRDLLAISRLPGEAAGDLTELAWLACGLGRDQTL